MAASIRYYQDFDQVIALRSMGSVSNPYPQHPVFADCLYNDPTSLIERKFQGLVFVNLSSHGFVDQGNAIDKQHVRIPFRFQKGRPYSLARDYYRNRGVRAALRLREAGAHVPKSSEEKEYFNHTLRGHIDAWYGGEASFDITNGQANFIGYSNIDFVNNTIMFDDQETCQWDLFPENEEFESSYKVKLSNRWFEGSWTVLERTITGQHTRFVYQQVYKVWNSGQPTTSGAWVEVTSTYTYEWKHSVYNLSLCHDVPSNPTAYGIYPNSGSIPSYGEVKLHCNRLTTGWGDSVSPSWHQQYDGDYYDTDEVSIRFLKSKALPDHVDLTSAMSGGVPRLAAALRETALDPRRLKALNFKSTQHALETDQIFTTNFIEVMSEFSSLLNLIGDAKKISKLFKALKDKQVLRAIDQAADSVLWYKFGVSPTVSVGEEISNRFHLIQERLLNDVPSTLRGKFAVVHDASGTVVEARTKIVLKPITLNVFGRIFLTLFRLGLSPTPGQIYEAVPNSFIVDRIVPFGPLLDAVDTWMLTHSIYQPKYYVHSIATMRDVSTEVSEFYFNNCEFAGNISEYKYHRYISIYGPRYFSDPYGILDDPSSWDTGVTESLAWTKVRKALPRN